MSKIKLMFGSINSDLFSTDFYVVIIFDTTTHKKNIEIKLIFIWLLYELILLCFYAPAACCSPVFKATIESTSANI